MRLELADFRDYIGIEQEPVQSNVTTGRSLSLPRRGIRLSNLGVGASRSDFRSGRALACNRRQSSMGTKTAVSTPRRVTIWGPFWTVASSNSLKRALAS